MQTNLQIQLTLQNLQDTGKIRTMMTTRIPLKRYQNITSKYKDRFDSILQLNSNKPYFCLLFILVYQFLTGWVVGNEPCIAIDFTGAKEYAKSQQQQQQLISIFPGLTNLSQIYNSEQMRLVLLLLLLLLLLFQAYHIVSGFSGM